MQLHQRTVERLGEFAFAEDAQRILVRERLEAELTAKASIVAQQICYRAQTVPRLPQVCVAVPRRVDVLEKFAARRRARPIGSDVVELRDFFAQVLIIERSCLFDVLDHDAPAERHLLYLVVAVPQRERRVMANAADVVFDLFVHLGDKVLSAIGEGRAGEHAVLPYKDAVAVAQVVKVVALVVSAAPNAQHVHVGVRGGRDQKFEVVVRGARDEAVRRHPIRAARKDGLAVEDKAEVGAPFVGGQVEFDRPQTEVQSMHVVDVVRTGGGQRVERLFAAAVALPQLGICHFDRDVFAVEFGEFFAVGRGQNIVHRRALFAVKLGREFECDLAAVVMLTHAHAVQLRAVVGEHICRLDDAALQQVRRPVPAEVICRFADVAGAGFAFGGVDHRHLFLPLGDVVERVGKLDRYGVFPRGEHVFDVEDISAVRVLYAGDALAVDDDLGESVEHLEDEYDMFAFEVVRAHLEGARKGPIMLADPLHLGLVAAYEGIGDDPGVDEVEEVAAGNGRGNAFDFVGIGQRPNSAQVCLVHCSSAAASRRICTVMIL